MKLMHVTQKKSVAASIIILWANHYDIAIRQTTDHMNTCFKAVCRSMENDVITPCTICHHVCEVSIPR